MRSTLIFCLSAVFAGVFPGSIVAQSQPPMAGVGSATSSVPVSAPKDQPSQKPKTDAVSQPTEVDEVVNKIIKREHDQVILFSLYKPITETYVQEMKPDKQQGVVPHNDYYFLGQADLSRGVFIRSMLPRREKTGTGDGNLEPAGFLQMIFVDPTRFDDKHYSFHYAGREFLGQVRCLMFDLAPLHKKDKGMFQGRIWVEDEDSTIVRFSGVYVPQKTWKLFDAHANFHFDSWRLNIQPGTWLPAYIYVGEPNFRELMITHRIKAQTRFWGYSLASVQHESEFSDLTIDPSNSIQDDAAQEEHDRSPIEAERAFKREGEDNAVDTLERTGLIAPAGSMDKVLDTVLNNLMVTNNLEMNPVPHCRVLITSNIELFTVGHTIVMSRGLIDVLPDEGTLAVILAQELADAIVPKSIVDKYAFGDSLQVPTEGVMKKFTFKDTKEDWSASGQKAMELLRNSPYRDKLENAALFFAQLHQDSRSLTRLIDPNLGNRIFTPVQFTTSGTELNPGKLDQIAALPIGARTKLDPWTDQIEILKSKPVPLESSREKMPFEVTPFMPFLVRYGKTNAAPNLDQATSGKDHQAQPNK
jgi:hypothetical protein